MFSLVIVVLFFLLGVVLSVITLDSGVHSSLVSAAFMLNVAVCSYFLYRLTKMRKLSAYSVFYIYYAFFLVIIPILQYIYSIYPWAWEGFTPINYSSDMYLIANISILISMIIFHYGYTSYFPKQIRHEYVFDFKISGILLVMITAVTVLCLAIVIIKLGPMQLVFRSGGDGSSDAITAIIVSAAIRVIPVAGIFILMACAYKYNQRWSIIYLMGLLLIILFPLSVARFRVLGVYLPMLIILGLIKNNRQLLYAFFGIYFIAYPIFGLFRRISSFADVYKVLSDKSPFIDISTGDFDNYSMLLRLVGDISINGFSYGYNLLSAFFFFVPRIWWSSKGIGTGNIVADNLGWKFQNVSMPLVGDFYFAFGIIGVIIGFYFFGKIIKYLDAAETNSIKYFISIILIGMMQFILRGALISTWANTAGYIAALFVASFLIKMLIKPKVV